MSPIQEQEKEEKYVTVQIPKEILGELKWLVEQTGWEPEEALREAIATEAYLLKRGSIKLKKPKAA